MFNRVQKAIRHPSLAMRHVAFVSRRRWELLNPRYITKGRAWLFDRVNGVKTRTIVAHGKLAPVDGLYSDNATYYAACPLSTLKMTIGYVVETYDGAHHFVDIGCGEGRACFFASRYFQKIIGLNSSPALIETANKNLQNFTGERQKIDFLLANAATFQLPEEECVVFMFHPFDEVVMGRFLETNYRHFSRYHSIIVYVSDVYSELLLKAGFLRSYTFTGGPKAASIYTACPQIAAPESVQ